MKSLVPIIFLLTLIASGCSQEEIARNESTTSSGRTFTASFESNKSRTYLEDGHLSRWTKNDHISLFDGNTLNHAYQFDGETGDNGGTFSLTEKAEGTARALTANYAVYPYVSDMYISETGMITTTLPSKQNYAVNSFGPGANTMVAVTKDTDDTFLTFKNVGGCFKLQLYGQNMTVKSITLTGNNNEKIAGKANITPVYANNPKIEMTDEATNTITLDCGEGIKIGETAETATPFWMVIPPTSFENGITITVKDINNHVFFQSTAQKLLIERNMIKPMAPVEVKPDIPYLTFVANETQTLKMTKAVESLEYSINGDGWKELATHEVTFGGTNGVLRLRGRNSDGTATSPDDYSRIVFKDNNIPVICRGDIRTLLDYLDYDTVDTEYALFCKLFENCFCLTTAPELPATALNYDCYYGMFRYCTSLKQAPALPATTLEDGCYKYMFECCTTLTEAPNLPATTLAGDCYYGMFLECTNLGQAPALPATMLDYNCYMLMFKKCTNLTVAPKLPAKTLADNCYEGMFSGCTSLIKAPELPATTLSGYCYRDMFNGCTSLTTAPEQLPATILTNQCYTRMFNNCSVLTKVPAVLPATTLTTGCYYEMFNGCARLKQAPNIMATTLANGCCSDMFKGCVKLTQAPSSLSAKTLANRCYSGMFNGCTNLKQAPSLPATTLAVECYKEMFKGCTSLTTAPILPAQTLVEDCYDYMFEGCKRLNSITMLAYSYKDISSYITFWVDDVATTGTFIKAKDMRVLKESVSGIPYGWTVKDYSE